MSAALKHDPPLTRMTAEQFLDWEPGDDFRWQLIDGELFCMEPPAQRHGAIHAQMAFLLTGPLLVRKDPCRVTVGTGVQPKIESKYNVRIPDLTIDCDEMGPDSKIVANPTLVVEILSPGNERVSRSNLWSYRSIPTVRTILLLYSWKVAAELSVRTEDVWPDAPMTLGRDDRLVLPEAGLDVPLADAYATTDLLTREQRL